MVFNGVGFDGLMDDAVRSYGVMGDDIGSYGAETYDFIFNYAFVYDGSTQGASFLVTVLDAVSTSDVSFD